MNDKDLPETDTSLIGFKNGFTNKNLFEHNEIINKKAKNDNIPGNDFNSKNTTDNSKTEILEPEYLPNSLLNFYHISDTLATCIDVYEVNILGFGYEFIKDLNTFVNEDGQLVNKNTNKVIPQETLEKIEEEEAKLDMLFKYIVLDSSWTSEQSLKIKLKEITGNSYYEIERNSEEEINSIQLIESNNVRITKFEKTPIDFKVWIKNPKTFEYEARLRSKRFRKFIQYNSNLSNVKTWFKEFGDPRVMNSNDGQYYSEYNEIKKEWIGPKVIFKNNKPVWVTGINEKPLPKEFDIATEIIHYKITDPKNIKGYGVPRWISLVPVLLGVRSADLFNYGLLKNKGIPDLMLIIEGAKSGTIKESIQDQILEDKSLGKFGSMLVVAAEGRTTGYAGPDQKYSNPSIKIEKLSALIEKEGLNLDYIDNSSERVFSRFRLSQQFVGRNNDLNRATAEVAEMITQQQVFDPERIKDDEITNNKIFNDLQVKYHFYKSKSKRLQNKELLSKILSDFVGKGLVPNDARRLISGILDEPLEEIKEDFMKVPLPIALLDRKAEAEALKNQEIEKSLEAPELIQLEESKDSEVLTKIKKMVKKAYNLKNIKDIYIYNNQENKKDGSNS